MISSIVSKLENSDWTFAKSDPRPGRHKMHTYPAAMAVPYVNLILDSLNEECTTLLDPFGGSGTVAIEGIKRGLNCWSNDLNPLASLITMAKLTQLNSDFNESYELLLSNINTKKIELSGQIESAKHLFGNEEDELKKQEKDSSLFERLSKITDISKLYKFKNIAYWFKPSVIVALQGIKEILPNIPFFKIVFSECVRVVSNRRSGEFKLFRRDKKNLVDYCPDVFESFLKILNRNICLLKEDIVTNTSKCHITKDDAKYLKSIADDSVDCVITSPPYGDSRTTVAYGQFSRLSLQWLGIEEQPPGQIDNLLLGGKNAIQNDLELSCMKEIMEKIYKICPERCKEVKSFFCDVDKVIESLSKKCKKNSYQFWIVGNRNIKNTRIPLDDAIIEISKRHGISHLKTFHREIPYKTMPTKNAPSNIVGEISETMTKESIVLFQK